MIGYGWDSHRLGLLCSLCSFVWILYVGIYCRFVSVIIIMILAIGMKPYIYLINTIYYLIYICYCNINTNYILVITNLC